MERLHLQRTINEGREQIFVEDKMVYENLVKKLEIIDEFEYIKIIYKKNVFHEQAANISEKKSRRIKSERKKQLRR